MKYKATFFNTYIMRKKIHKGKPMLKVFSTKAQARTRRFNTKEYEPSEPNSVFKEADKREKRKIRKSLSRRLKIGKNLVEMSSPESLVSFYKKGKRKTISLLGAELIIAETLLSDNFKLENNPEPKQAKDSCSLHLRKRFKEDEMFEDDVDINELKKHLENGTRRNTSKQDS